MRKEKNLCRGVPFFLVQRIFHTNINHLPCLLEKEVFISIVMISCDVTGGDIYIFVLSIVYLLVDYRNKKHPSSLTDK